MLLKGAHSTDDCSSLLVMPSCMQVIDLHVIDFDNVYNMFQLKVCLCVSEQHKTGPFARSV